MIRYIIAILVFLTMAQRANADSGRSAYSVLIDTDGALDDFRAITMFLAGQDFTVLGVTASQGTLPPEQTCEKINSLLSSYYHNGIPIGVGVATAMPLPEWSGFAKNIPWAKNPGNIAIQRAFDVIEKAVANSPEKLCFVALGSLSNYAYWFKHTRQNPDKIEQIVWYAGADLFKQFNYFTDKAAYADIIKTGVPLIVVSKGEKNIPVNEAYLSMLKKAGSNYSENVSAVLTSPQVQEKLRQGHSQLWDDIVPLYLAHPDLFELRQGKEFATARLKPQVSEAEILSDIGQIFNSKTEAMNRVFINFPTHKNLYKPAYANMVDTTLHHFGLAEWKAVVLTNEVHGHTGIYSIIGAKAGIRACEYFNVGVNNLFAESYAGHKPPLSCYNDGIQISTGATIGQGLLSVSDTILQTPTVVFSFNGQKVKITLKNEISKKMQNDINAGVKKFGMSGAYWEYIENLAQEYWAYFNRYNIFELENMP